jgi:2-methylisocitrate lyase-like PEP mutase family enzyme
MTRSTHPRLHFHPDELVKIGGAHDALSATLLARAGFSAVWMSGFALSAAQFAMPNVTLVSMTESIDAVRRMSEAANVPVVVDARTGA